MRRAALLLVVLSAGCRASPTSGPAPPTTAAGDAARHIASDKENFKEMVRAYAEDPARAAKTYQYEVLSIEMTVETAKDAGKGQYEVTGVAEPVRATFDTHLDPNRQVPAVVQPGVKVRFNASVTGYQPGSPRGELRVFAVFSGLSP